MMRSRLLIAVALIGFGAFGGACMMGRQGDKSMQDDFVDISRLPANERAEIERLNGILFRVEGANQVEGAIKEIVQIGEAKNATETARVYAALLKPMLKMKGIVYRLRFLVESVNVAYIQSISALRAFKRNSDRRAGHINAFFDYLTTPNPNDTIAGKKGPFMHVSEFQDWMATAVAPDIRISLGTLKEIASKHNPRENIFYYDIALMIGKMDADTGERNSVSTTRRYRKVAAGDLWVLIADMEERMGMGYYLASYNLEDLARFINSLTLKTFAQLVVPGRKPFDVELNSPKEITEELRRPFQRKDEFQEVVRARGPGAKLRAVWESTKDRWNEVSAYSDFLTLRDQGRKSYLKQAHDHIKLAIEARTNAMKAMEATAGGASSQEFFLNPKTYTSRPGFTLNILNKRLREVKGPDEFTDRVTGEGFPINIAAMFDTTKIPQDPKMPGIHDLKTLFPNHFKPGPQRTGSGDKTFAWNYEYGMADGWPDPTFAGVLPGTVNPEGEKVAQNSFPSKLTALSRDASTRVLQMWLRIFML